MFSSTPRADYALIESKHVIDSDAAANHLKKLRVFVKVFIKILCYGFVTCEKNVTKLLLIKGRRIDHSLHYTSIANSCTNHTLRVA